MYTTYSMQKFSAHYGCRKLNCHSKSTRKFLNPSIFDKGKMDIHFWISGNWHQKDDGDIPMLVGRRTQYDIFFLYYM